MTVGRPGDRLVGVDTVPQAAVEQARGIYEAGFPAAVRAPFEDLLRVRPDERTQLLVDDGAVLGLDLVRDLGETGWTFLRYFVVTAERRGQGIGARLWAALCQDLAARGCGLLLFDVEDPDDPTADAHASYERTRRVRFYRRLGADVVDFAAYEPPHHGAPRTDPIPLRLMASRLDATGGSSHPRLLPDAAERAVETVMWHRYGVTP